MSVTFEMRMVILFNLLVLVCLLVIVIFWVIRCRARYSKPSAGADTGFLEGGVQYELLMRGGTSHLAARGYGGAL